MAHVSWSKPRRKWKRFGAIVLGTVAVGILLLQYAVRGGFAGEMPAAEAGGVPISVGAPEHKIAGRVFVHGVPAAEAPLVIVLHGDAPFRKPGYHYSFAASLSEQLTAIPVVALLRPGFADPYGGRSDGERGNASGDDYTKEVVEDLSRAIESLRNQFFATSVVLIGHSGGAAIAANLTAASPRLVDLLIPVSCPCNVPEFRKRMARQQLNPFWLWPSDSVSPLATVEQLGTTRIRAITGEDDSITVVPYARAYIDAAKERGLDATLTVLPERGHEILNDEAVLELARQWVAEFPPKGRARFNQG